MVTFASCGPTPVSAQAPHVRIGKVMRGTSGAI